VSGACFTGSRYAAVKRGDEIAVDERFAGASLAVKVMIQVQTFEGEVSLGYRKESGNGHPHDFIHAFVTCSSDGCRLCMMNSAGLVSAYHAVV
jgi:hypothetical protein